MTNPVRLRLITYNARLLDARREKGLTQKHLSQLTGVSASHIGFIETLRVMPKQQVMDEICSALQLSQDYLFPPVLIEAIREGLFDTRVAELEEKQIIRLTEGRRAGLLPQRITQDEVLETIEKDIDNTILRKKLLAVLNDIPPRGRRVLELRYGLIDGISRTLEEVAEEFNVTKERIRQMEAKALRQIRHPRLTRKLKDYLE